MPLKYNSVKTKTLLISWKHRETYMKFKPVIPYTLNCMNAAQYWDEIHLPD